MNMQKRLLAKRYAVAFFNVYKNQVVDADFQALDRAYCFFIEHKNINCFMKLTSLDENHKKEALRIIIKKIGLSEVFISLLDLLTDQKRTCFLPELFFALKVQFKKVKNITEWTVQSSLTLSKERKGYIEGMLKKISKNNIRCTYKLDTTLIAGIRLQSEQLLWESSVRQKLQRITRFLMR